MPMKHRLSFCALYVAAMRVRSSVPSMQKIVGMHAKIDTVKANTCAQSNNSDQCYMCCKFTTLLRCCFHHFTVQFPSCKSGLTEWNDDAQAEMHAYTLSTDDYKLMTVVIMASFECRHDAV